ncbi:SETMR methyltransferase, partial [Acromyrmex insinuator]
IDISIKFYRHSLTFVKITPLEYIYLCVCFRFFTVLKMELNLQQRVCIKFCVKNGFNGAKTLEMLGNCFGSDVLKKTTVYEWHERFRSGRESVEDNERSGRPSTSKTDENINKVREMLANNRKLIIRELAEDLNIAYGSVQASTKERIFKKPLRGTRFNSRKEVMEKSKTALMAIPIIEFQKCFESWIKRWHKCVAVAGEYFEGNNITFDE